MTEQEINNLIDSKIGKTKMSQLPEATQTSGLYSIGYNGNQSVKYKANLLQGDPLTVRKTYQTEAEALADKNPIDTTTSLPLTVGQFVSIVDDGENNGIYRIGSIGVDGTMSLELQGKLGDLSDYAKKGGSTKTLKEVDDEIVQLDKILILHRGQFLSNSIKQYVPFSVKQNDVVHVVTSNVDLVITDPLTEYYSVSLTKDESFTNTQIVVSNEVVEKDVYIVANSDYEYVYLHVDPPTGVVSYDVKIEIIPFEKLKDWILSEAYTISSITYDSFGNVKTAQLTYPDGTEGAIQTSTSDAEGRLLTVIFTYGERTMPAIIRLQMTITYLGDLVDTITINKV